MTPFLSRLGTLALAATAGFALAPVASAQQQPAPSDQAVENQVVHDKQTDRHLAPHDTFYTMKYVSKQMPDGVDGYPPGTEVHLVSVNREAHKLTVTDGHTNIELPPSDLTNDMDIAAMVRAQDAANQERIVRYQQAEEAAYQKYEKEVADYTAKDLQHREQAIQQANEQRAEMVAENHTTAATTDSAAISSSDNNGYYNQGGYGYGSPYSYFVDLNGYNRSNNTSAAARAIQANGSNGNGALPSTQNATQSGNARTGGATSGTASSTGGGKAGGKP